MDKIMADPVLKAAHEAAVKEAVKEAEQKARYEAFMHERTLIHSFGAKQTCMQSALTWASVHPLC